MNHPLNEAKIGDLFHITEREGKSFDAFFAGVHESNDAEGFTTYNFLYWGKFSQRVYEQRLPNAPKGYKWQTSDFFTYKEDIISSLGKVLNSDYNLYYAPLLSYFNGSFSIQKPWLALCGYQFETSDINTLLNNNSYLKITKLEGVSSTQVLRQPVLPKRKEVIIHV